MLIDWSRVDWAIILATIVSPIAAVIITLWHQKRWSKRLSRENIFVAMMKTRRNPTNVEFVGALNLVPVYFYSYKTVMQRYADLMDTFEDPSWYNSEARPRLSEQVELKVAYLLSEISKVLGQPIEQLQVLRGGYAPQGWKDEEQAQIELRQSLSAILNGNRPLPVWVISPTPLNTAATKQDASPDSEKSLPEQTQPTDNRDTIT